MQHNFLGAIIQDCWSASAVKHVPVSSQYTEANSMTETQASYASPTSRIGSIHLELSLLIWL